MISSKYFKVIVGILLSITIVFTVCIIGWPKNNGSVTGITQEYEAKAFNKNKITTVNISMDKTKWEDMLKNALKEEYYTCDITINGEVFKNVGIRAKGNTSLTQVASSDSNRFSFKIDFDQYVDGQTYYGLDKMVLNNQMSDTTNMKEALAYDLMEYIGVKTPLYAYTDVSVNGENWGLYLGIEAVEESFSQRNFGSNYGELYKPESMNMGGGQGGNKAFGGGQGGNKEFSDGKAMTPPNMENGENPPSMGENPPSMGESPKGNGEEKQNQNTNGESATGKESQSENQERKGPMGGGGPGGNSKGSDLVYTDDSISSYSTIFDSSVFKTTSSDHKRVISALKGLSTGKDLENYVDVDSTLRYFAANTFLVNLDSYVSNLQHNYYLYEKDSKISILPWDFNLAFAGFQGGSATTAVNFPIDTPVTGVELSERPLIGKLLENEDYKTTYHEYLQKLVDEYFNSGVFENRVDEINSLIKDYVKNDPTAFYTYEEYEKSIPVLKSFGTLRSKSVEGQLDGSVPSTTSEQNTSKDKLIDASSINLNTLGTQGGGRGKGETTEKTDNARGENQPNKDNSSKTEEASESNRENKQRSMDMKNPMGNVQNQSIDKNSIIVLCFVAVVLVFGISFVIKYKRRK